MLKAEREDPPPLGVERRRGRRLRMGTAATTFQTALAVPVRRARMKGLQAPLQACSALHSPAGSDRPAGFPFALPRVPGAPKRMQAAAFTDPAVLESPPSPVAPRRGFSFVFFRARLAPGAVLESCPMAERRRRMQTRATVLNSRCSRYLPSSPRRETGGVFVKCLVIRPPWLEPAHQLRCHRKPR